MQYDVIIIGAGPGGIFSAYELSKLCPDKKIAVFEEGQPLEKRRCPIDGKTVKHCIGCPTCAIMNGFGGAGAFSDGKYNLTNDFGGTLYEYIGKKQAMELMHYVDEINVSHGGENTKLYSTANSAFKTRCLQCGLHLLDASVRHLGTDINFVVLKNLFAELEPKVDFHFRTPVRKVLAKDGGYEIVTRVILHRLLPEGAVIPASRGQLALLVWNTAGRPEPAGAPAFADVTDPDMAKAAQWCTEQGLLDAREGKFESDGWMPKFKTIEIWNKAFPKK